MTPDGEGGEKAMEDYGLTIEVRQEPGHVLVTVAGEVDLATVPQLRDWLAAPAASGRPVIVDLDGVTFTDAAGLGVPASAARRAAARGASLHAVCARHQVRRLFTTTGLDRQIPLARTITEACQNLDMLHDGRPVYPWPYDQCHPKLSPEQADLCLHP
jgi:anti-sigma B factor antagonist